MVTPQIGHQSWQEFHKGSILGPLLFLVYINDLPDNIESIAKLFADDTSLSSTVYNPLLFAEIMSKDLIKI